VSAALALLRAGWLSALSYRLEMALSVGGLLVLVVPLYFVAHALQPVMADSIRGQGGDYFAFVLVGIMAIHFLGPAVNALPGAVGSSIRSGTLEALLGTPASRASLLGGLVAYDLTWAVVRAAVLATAGIALGAWLEPAALLPALGVMALIVAAHLPFGLLAAALVLAFRTPGPLPRVAIAASVLLGGAYYPTEVIPDALRVASAAMPLTYGLRALRGLLLEGASPAAVAPDVAVLAVFAAGLLAVGALVFAAALRYARGAGTLAQY
jgi:ABC-2 type transport system permease protein